MRAASAASCSPARTAFSTAKRSKIRANAAISFDAPLGEVQRSRPGRDQHLPAGGRPGQQRPPTSGDTGTHDGRDSGHRKPRSRAPDGGIPRDAPGKVARAAVAEQRDDPHLMAGGKLFDRLIEGGASGDRIRHDRREDQAPGSLLHADLP
jgi:hypothetical protein